MPRYVSKRKTRRTNRRLARVRLERPGALKGVQADNRYTAREARRVRRVDSRLRRRSDQKKAATRYDPLAPLTGKRERQERKAAMRLQFGGVQRELNEATRAQEQKTADTGSYYDDYRQALREATARVNEANRQNVEATEGRIDSAYAQDKAAVTARDQAASETAAKLGRGPVQSQEGHQAVEAQRSQGNQSAANLRGQAAADTSLLEKRGATAVLAKAEALKRQQGKEGELRRERSALARERGAAKVEHRAKTRESERQWAAIQKEFKLERRDQSLRHQATRADRQLERQKIAAQKIVARMYANADKAGARAQIRVAKLQLEKGRISQKQYREIVNIYRGLPEKGKAPGPADPSKKPLTVTEEKTVKQAFNRLKKAGVRVDQKSAAINQLVGKYGYPPRIAREAWKRYARRAPGMNPEAASPNEGRTF